MEFSVILPIYNEKETIAEVTAELESVLRKMQKPYEIVLVDDGSTDGTREILRTLASQNTNIRVVLFRRNEGQSAAFDAGFRHASGRVVITMDADGQNDPADIPRMVELMEQGYDFVSGWRRKRQDVFLSRRLPSIIANWIIRKVTRARVHDLGCSLKACRKEIIDDLRLYGEMHRYISVLVDGLGARIAELEVNHRPRLAGQSKYGLSRTVRVVLDLITVFFLGRYQTKPLYFFGPFAIAAIFAGALLSVLGLYQKFWAGVWVHKNPIFVLAILLFVLAGQFIGMGLISELHARTYYESQGKPTYYVAERINFAPQSKDANS